MTDNRMTAAELKQLFPRGIPAPVMKFLFPERFCGDLDINDFRAIVRACAKGQDVLIGYMMFPILENIGDVQAHVFGGQPAAVFAERYGSSTYGTVVEAVAAKLNATTWDDRGQDEHNAKADNMREVLGNLICVLFDNGTLNNADVAALTDTKVVE